MANAQTLTLPSHAQARTGSHQRLSPGSVEVRVTQAADVDKALDEAIAAVSPSAAEHRIGIMVTRVGAGFYMVRAHPDVPFGLTRQRYV